MSSKYINWEIDEPAVATVYLLLDLEPTKTLEMLRCMPIANMLHVSYKDVPIMTEKLQNILKAAFAFVKYIRLKLSNYLLPRQYLLTRILLLLSSHL